MCEAKGLLGEDYRALFGGLTRANRCTEYWVNHEIQRCLHDNARRLRYQQAKDAGMESPEEDSDPCIGGGGGVIVRAKTEIPKIPVPCAVILSSIGIPLPSNTPNLTINFDRIIMNGVFVTFEENKGKFADNQFVIFIIVSVSLRTKDNW